MKSANGADMQGQLLRGTGRMLIGLLLAAATGCNMIGAMANKMAGEQKTPAAYKLPKTPTLVFVESYQNPDLFNVQSQELAAHIAAILTDNKVTTVVPSTKLDELRGKDPAAFSRMDIPSIGRAVGAKQVIYVNLTRFQTDFPIAGTQYSGKCEARVKLFAAETGRVLWPPDTTGGRQVQYDSKPEENIDPRNLTAVQDQMTHHLAARVAELFYDAVPDEPDTSGP